MKVLQSLFLVILTFLFFSTPLFAVSSPPPASLSTELSLEDVILAASANGINLLSFAQIQCWYPSNISDILDDDSYDEAMRTSYRAYSASMQNFSDKERYANVISGLHKDFAIIKGDFDNDMSDDILIEDSLFNVHFFSGKTKELLQVFPDFDENRRTSDDITTSSSTGKIESWNHVPVQITYSDNQLIFYFAPETDFRGVYKIEQNKLINIDDPHSP